MDNSVEKMLPRKSFSPPKKEDDILNCRKNATVDDIPEHGEVDSYSARSPLSTDRIEIEKMSNISKRTNRFRIINTWESKLLNSLADGYHSIKQLDHNKSFKEFDGF